MDSLRKKKTILMVEDDDAFSAVLGGILRRAGYDVVEAYDGWQALELARRRRPDLITLDIGLPHASGMWFYRRKLLHGELGDVPLVVISGMDLGSGDPGAVFRRAMLREGLPAPQGYFEKPPDRSALLALLERLSGGEETSDRPVPAGDDGGGARKKGAPRAGRGRVG